MKSKTTYKKVTVDGHVAAAYKGSPPQRLLDLMGLKGVVVKMATKKEYEKYRSRRKKKNHSKGPLFLPGWDENKKGLFGGCFEKGD